MVGTRWTVLGIPDRQVCVKVHTEHTLPLYAYRRDRYIHHRVPQSTPHIFVRCTLVAGLLADPGPFSPKEDRSSNMEPHEAGRQRERVLQRSGILRNPLYPQRSW